MQMFFERIEMNRNLILEFFFFFNNYVFCNDADRLHADCLLIEMLDITYIVTLLEKKKKI